MAATTCPACSHPVDAHPPGRCPVTPLPAVTSDFEAPMDVLAERRYAQLQASALLGLHLPGADAIQRFRTAWQAADTLTAREQLTRLQGMS